MREATVVAFYGGKSPALISLILRIQEAALLEFGRSFTPRPVKEAHATLVGLGGAEILHESNDGVPGGRISALSRYLTEQFSENPLTVQFGGFKGRPYPFRSRGRSLHDRSVGVDENRLVIIGWPVVETPQGVVPSTAVDGIRRRCADFGFVHKYHDSPDAFDPDLYMVLGDFSTGVTDQVTFRDRVADWLGREDPTLVALTDRELSVVFYSDRRLPLSSSTPVAIDAVESLP